MQLENFNTAWKQIKLSNAMQHMDASDIFLIIDAAENSDRSFVQRVLFPVGMLAVITLFCQGG